MNRQQRRAHLRDVSDPEGNPSPKIVSSMMAGFYPIEANSGWLAVFRKPPAEDGGQGELYGAEIIGWAAVNHQTEDGQLIQNIVGIAIDNRTGRMGPAENHPEFAQYLKESPESQKSVPKLYRA